MTRKVHSCLGFASAKNKKSLISISSVIPTWILLLLSVFHHLPLALSPLDQRQSPEGRLLLLLGWFSQRRLIVVIGHHHQLLLLHGIGHVFEGGGVLDTAPDLDQAVH
jgi:hypothetical protein